MTRRAHTWTCPCGARITVSGPGSPNAELQEAAQFHIARCKAFREAAPPTKRSREDEPPSTGRYLRAGAPRKPNTTREYRRGSR